MSETEIDFENVEQTNAESEHISLEMPKKLL